MNSEKQVGVTKDELSLELTKQYSKKSCRKCLGRGYIITEVPKFKHGFRKHEPFLRLADYCTCV